MADVKLGIFDKEGKFYGYKTDTFWSLSNFVYKPHSLDNAVNLVKNFLSMLDIQSQDKPSDFIGKLVFSRDFSFVSKLDELHIRVIQIQDDTVVRTIILKKDEKGKFAFAFNY